MTDLKINCYYQIRCRNKDWGISVYGEWKYVGIANGNFWFYDENQATLSIPRVAGTYAPSEPWMLELLDN